MRVLLITVGSRGDAEPFCALAMKLVERGHSVDLFLQGEHHGLLPAAKESSALSLHTLPFCMMDFYQYVANPTHGADHPNPRVKFVGVVTDLIAGLVLPCWTQVASVAEASATDVVVSSSLARPLAIALSQKFAPTIKKLCIVHLQPLAPTGLFPHYSEESVQAIINLQQQGINHNQEKATHEEYRETYTTLDKFHHDFLKDRLDTLYEAENILPSLEFEDLMSYLNGEKALVANAFSSDIIPVDPAQSSVNVGSLADAYIPDGWTPPDETVHFLESCGDTTPPVCIGFGSMPFDKVTMVMSALETLYYKAILVGTAWKDAIENSGSDWAQTNTHVVENVPYPWLLPKCSMMVCHGGAGAVHATMRAGIPIVIAPLMGDQFFFADLLQHMGVGARACKLLPMLEEKDLSAAIGIAKKPECIEKAKVLGASMRSKPSGVDVLADALEMSVQSKTD